MEIRELAVSHAFEITPDLHDDDRGVFLESYRADLFADATGRTFELRQSNISVSRRGVARGIHFVDLRNEQGTTSGQAKYVTAVVGSVLDVVVDIRVGSPTYGRWDAVELDDRSRKAVFVGEGLGHLFIAISETATVNYLANDVYRPASEHGISAFDPALALDLPFTPDELVLSAQDRGVPTLAEARAQGVLPTWDDCLAVYAARSIGARS